MEAYVQRTKSRPGENGKAGWWDVEDTALVERNRIGLYLSSVSRDTEEEEDKADRYTKK